MRKFLIVMLVGLLALGSPGALFGFVPGRDDQPVTQSGTWTDVNTAAIKTAVQIIDNFITGSRGLVTEDNSAAIKTALELIQGYLYTLSEAVGADTRIDVDVISMPAISATLTDAVIYDTQMEQFKFTGDDLKIEDVTLTDTTIQATDLDIRALTSADVVSIHETSFDVGTVTTLPAITGAVTVSGVSTSANQTTGNDYLYKLSESVDTDTRVKTNANLQVGDADVSESNSVSTHQTANGWWTEYRYDLTDKVAADSAITVTKAASDGHEWVATGYSIGGVGCGPCSWRLLVNASMVACGTIPMSDYGGRTDKFPIPIKAGNNEAIALEVNVHGTSEAYVLMTLYGYEQ